MFAVYMISCLSPIPAGVWYVDPDISVEELIEAIELDPAPSDCLWLIPGTFDVD